MRKYEVSNISRNGQRIELDLTAKSIPSSLVLNSMAGGMKDALNVLERFDSIWIDFGKDDIRLPTKDNASKIKRIYLQKGCSDDFLDLLYER